MTRTPTGLPEAAHQKRLGKTDNRQRSIVLDSESNLAKTMYQATQDDVERSERLRGFITATIAEHRASILMCEATIQRVDAELQESYDMLARCTGRSGRN